MSNPLIAAHEEYDLYGTPEIGKAFLVDSSKPSGGADDWFWNVTADYTHPDRCSWYGHCDCKEWFSRGFDTEEEAAIFAVTLKTEARKIR